MKDMMARLRTNTEGAVRDFAEIDIEPQLNVGQDTPDDWHTFIEGWRAFGATHRDLGTMKIGFTTPHQHIATP